MLHARSDYQDRIQDLAGLIPDDEPVLLIRGQDQAAVITAQAWCKAAEDLGVDPKMIQMVKNHIDKIIKWQALVWSKVPDLP